MGLRTSSEFTNHKIRVSISGVKTFESQDAAAFSNFWDSYCDDAYLNDAEERWDTYFNNCHPEITTSCVYPWERLYVWHDGTINPCDVDYKSMLSPGNISQFESISEAWNSLHDLRAAHKSGNRSSYLPVTVVVYSTSMTKNIIIAVRGQGSHYEKLRYI